MVIEMPKRAAAGCLICGRTKRPSANGLFADDGWHACLLARDASGKKVMLRNPVPRFHTGKIVCSKCISIFMNRYLQLEMFGQPPSA
jgi:hypothetical protein